MFYFYDDRNGWGKGLKKHFDQQNIQSAVFKEASEVTMPGTVFMHPSHLPLDERDSNKQLIKELSARPDLTVVPSPLEVDIYDDKVAQCDVFGDWMPPTDVYLTKKDAVKGANIRSKESRFPFVSKSKQGAGASNARKISDMHQAWKEIKQVFSPEGMGCYADGIQKDYLLWQDWVPDLTVNWRVIVLAQKYVIVVKRWNQEGSEFVNDEGRIETLLALDEDSTEVVDMAIDLAKSCNLQWAALDFIRNPHTGKLYALEYSTGWPMWWMNSGMIFECLSEAEYAPADSPDPDKYKPYAYAREIIPLISDLLIRGEFCDSRPKVVWIYDVPKWAYWARSHQLTAKMPNYNHQFIGVTCPYKHMVALCDRADVIISMCHEYENIVLPWKDKVLLGVSGMRGLPDELAVSGDKLELELGSGNRGLDKQEQVSVCQDDTKREDFVPSPAPATL